jgi:hypothetical protein
MTDDCVKRSGCLRVIDDSLVSVGTRISRVVTRIRDGGPCFPDRKIYDLNRSPSDGADVQ